MNRDNGYIVKLEVGESAKLPADTTFGGSAVTAGWLNMGAGESMIGSSTSDITINTDKFTVAWATGNTVIGWTLAITGATAITGAITSASTITMATTQKILLRDANISISSANDWYMDLAADTAVRVTSPYLAITWVGATSLAVGRLGATTPAFSVDSSTASQVAGLNVKGAATGWVVAVVCTDSGADASLIIDAKGAGTIGIGTVSTGAITITPATTITGALTQTGLSTHTNGIVIGSAKKIEWAGTGTNGIILKNLKNAAASSLSGTQKDIEIDIGWVAYFFTCFPTKA